jgi:hypothetical protein
MMYVPKMSRDIQQGLYFQVVDVPLSAPIFISLILLSNLVFRLLSFLNMSSKHLRFKKIFGSSLACCLISASTNSRLYLI